MTHRLVRELRRTLKNLYKNGEEIAVFLHFFNENRFFILLGNFHP